MKAVDYYFSPMSPWTYLGHSRFADIAKRHGATINVKPVDFGKIFPVSGGVPVAKRAPQRQAYRFVELKRWQKFLGVPLVLEPKFFPYDTSLAARVIIAAGDQSADSAMRLTGALLKACWTENRNMADESELAKVCEEVGLEPKALIAAAKSDEGQ
ncbi:MAG TPA: 2-hydroxychromene-2-carboxylate isomerase, partial [Burkholderiales bacterium]